MELLEREREEREGRLQRSEGNGPKMLELGRLTEETELVEGMQEMPRQLQGVESPSFQFEKTPSGSSKESLICWR